MKWLVGLLRSYHMSNKTTNTKKYFWSVRCDQSDVRSRHKKKKMQTTKLITVAACGSIISYLIGSQHSMVFLVLL